MLNMKILEISRAKNSLYLKWYINKMPGVSIAIKPYPKPR